MLLRLDRSKYLALVEYTFAESDELQALLVKWKNHLPGGAAASEMSPFSQEFIPLGGTPEVTESILPVPPWVNPAQMPSPVIDPALNPAQMPQFPEGTMPSYMGGAMPPPPMHYPQPPMHYPPGYLAGNPHWATYNSRAMPLYPQPELGASDRLAGPALEAQKQSSSKRKPKTDRKAAKATAKKSGTARVQSKLANDLGPDGPKQGSNKINAKGPDKVGKNKINAQGPDQRVLSI
jgi:hypothetical protein